MRTSLITITLSLLILLGVMNVSSLSAQPSGLIDWNIIQNFNTVLFEATDTLEPGKTVPFKVYFMDQHNEIILKYKPGFAIRIGIEGKNITDDVTVTYLGNAYVLNATTPFMEIAANTINATDGFITFDLMSKGALTFDIVFRYSVDNYATSIGAFAVNLKDFNKDKDYDYYYIPLEQPFNAPKLRAFEYNRPSPRRSVQGAVYKEDYKRAIEKFGK